MQTQSENSVSTNEIGKTEHLLITTDSHHSIHLHISSPSTISHQTFEFKIRQIEQTQQLHMYKAIWVHLNQYNLSYIQFLLQKDYQIHRGHKKDVSLYKWTADFKDCIPLYSRIFIGCGAMVIKDDCVFLVQQKSVVHYQFKGDRKGLFGLPGGRADPGEFISVATERELFEETGLKGKYQYIVYFRQIPKSLWNSFDIYFVSVIKVEQQEFKNMKLCQNEIASYKWVHLSEYGDFMQKNGSPSQTHVGKHVSELYKKGYNFKQEANITTHKLYKAGGDLKIMQHYVAGVDLLRYK